MTVRQKPCPITAPSRPQRGGGDGDMTVNKNPQGPVTRPGGCHSGIFAVTGTTNDCL